MNEPTKPTDGTPPKHTSASPRQSSRRSSVQQATTPPLPAPDDREGWKQHWEALDQPWRTEPEINEERQEFLNERRAIQPNIEKGIYPFKDIKLSRADVEWLLATHESGGMRGPVEWGDEKQYHRKGLDLRGAHLQKTDLRWLPLAGVRCGLTAEELFDTTSEQRAESATHLEWANLYQAHLEGAVFHEAYMEWVFFRQAFLQHADLSEAHLRGSNVREAHLEQANLALAHMEGTKLRSAHLAGANLQLTFFDIATDLSEVSLTDHEYGGATVADIHWNGVNLSVVPWETLARLGDEQRARRSHLLADYQTAVRANRQLAIALRNQGLNEVADRFAYRAQLCQRVVLRRQGSFIKYLGSWLLWLIAGYGYRPGRSIIVYLSVILAFMGFYLLNAQFVSPHLTWDQALVLSVSSFHGRGFFEQDIMLGSTFARLAAAEAVVGLLIEISFIATFTQRFFGR